MKKTMKPIIIGLIVIGLIGVAAFIASRYLLINTKDSVVNQKRYLGNHSNPANIYDQPATGKFYSPLNADVAHMDKLLLVDIEDDPEYSSIELQIFDDARGQGARVLLYHQVGPADSYWSSEAFVDEAETNSNYIVPDMEYSLSITKSAVTASLKMQDKEGKSIEFNLKEAPRKNWAKGFLAPIGGGSAITFDYFPFFHMKDMNFVLRPGTKLVIKIGGEPRTPVQIPIPVNWEMVYLSRYTASPIIGRWNRPYDGELPALQPEPQLTYQDGQTRYELVDNAGHYEIRKMAGFDDKHEVSFEFSPPIPDLPALKDGAEINGRFSAGADEILGIVAGVYHIKRQGQVIEMEILPLEGWQPNPGSIWVKTWTWKGVITVGAGDNVSLKSEWTRTE